MLVIVIRISQPQKSFINLLLSNSNRCFSKKQFQIKSRGSQTMPYVPLISFIFFLSFFLFFILAWIVAELLRTCNVEQASVKFQIPFSVSPFSFGNAYDSKFIFYLLPVLCNSELNQPLDTHDQKPQKQTRKYCKSSPPSPKNCPVIITFKSYNW